jgi:hypothetical protein
VKRARHPRSLSDRVAWAIFATGIVAMLVASYVCLISENDAALYERRGFFQFLFFAASVFALCGPLTATIGQLFPVREGTTSGKKYEAIGLEDL